MYGAVGSCIGPRPVFDICVCGVFADDESEHESNAAVGIKAYVVVATRNVGGDDFGRGVATGPLHVVARTAHIGFGRVVNGHDDGEVGCC